MKRLNTLVIGFICLFGFTSNSLAQTYYDPCDSHPSIEKESKRIKFLRTCHKNQIDLYNLFIFSGLPNILRKADGSAFTLSNTHFNMVNENLLLLDTLSPTSEKSILNSAYAETIISPYKNTTIEKSLYKDEILSSFNEIIKESNNLILKDERDIVETQPATLLIVNNHGGMARPSKHLPKSNLEPMLTPLTGFMANMPHRKNVVAEFLYNIQKLYYPIIIRRSGEKYKFEKEYKWFKNLFEKDHPSNLHKKNQISTPLRQKKLELADLKRRFSLNKNRYNSKQSQFDNYQLKYQNESTWHGYSGYSSEKQMNDANELEAQTNDFRNKMDQNKSDGQRTYNEIQDLRQKLEDWYHPEKNIVFENYFLAHLDSMVKKVPWVENHLLRLSYMNESFKRKYISDYELEMIWDMLMEFHSYEYDNQYLTPGDEILPNQNNHLYHTDFLKLLKKQPTSDGVVKIYGEDQVKLKSPLVYITNSCYDGDLHQLAFKTYNMCGATSTNHKSPAWTNLYYNNYFDHISEYFKLDDPEKEKNLFQAHLFALNKSTYGKGMLSSSAYLRKSLGIRPYTLDYETNYEFMPFNPQSGNKNRKIGKIKKLRAPSDYFDFTDEVSIAHFFNDLIQAIFELRESETYVADLSTPEPVIETKIEQDPALSWNIIERDLDEEKTSEKKRALLEEITNMVIDKYKNKFETQTKNFNDNGKVGVHINNPIFDQDPLFFTIKDMEERVASVEAEKDKEKRPPTISYVRDFYFHKDTGLIKDASLENLNIETNQMNNLTKDQFREEIQLKSVLHYNQSHINKKYTNTLFTQMRKRNIKWIDLQKRVDTLYHEVKTNWRGFFNELPHKRLEYLKNEYTYRQVPKVDLYAILSEEDDLGQNEKIRKVKAAFKERVEKVEAVYEERIQNLNRYQRAKNQLTFAQNEIRDGLRNIKNIMNKDGFFAVELALFNRFARKYNVIVDNEEEISTEDKAKLFKLQKLVNLIECEIQTLPINSN
ncbi:hypothetical protein N9N67_01610 [Bacteriovoracaceae bacterium]|nr:hypothetical protein [Bacteriovoracaceae bacterium]